MLIAGAGGHAVELLTVLEENFDDEQFVFFDDVSVVTELFLGRYLVMSTIDQVSHFFRTNPNFCLAVGKPRGRFILAQKLLNLGGRLMSTFSSNAFIGKNEVKLGMGLNIMQYASISGRCRIGDGVLVHMHASIHHDVSIGDYCELSPGCRILGGAKVGSLVSIGTNAIVMPNVVIGDGAVVGAGAVVTKDVAPGITVIGIPAKPISKLT